MEGKELSRQALTSYSKIKFITHMEKNVGHSILNRVAAALIRGVMIHSKSTCQIITGNRKFLDVMMCMEVSG